MPQCHDAVVRERGCSTVPLGVGDFVVPTRPGVPVTGSWS